MLIKMGVRNILKYRRRSIVIFVAIIFSIFILVLAMGFIEGSKEMLNRVIFENIGHITIYKEGYYKKSEMLPIDLLIQKPDEIINRIKKVEGIKRINQEMKFGSMIRRGKNMKSQRPKRPICQSCGMPMQKTLGFSASPNVALNLVLTLLGEFDEA